MSATSRGRARLRAVALVAVTSLALVACAETGDQTGPVSTSPGTTDSAEPVQGGTLRFTLDRDPVCLDPHQSALTASLAVTRGVVDSLTDQDPETGEITPWLAESWEISEDLTTFTFTLREGLLLQDGSTLDAQVVADNFQHILDLGALSSFGAGYVRGLTDIEVLDDLVVELAFDAPNAQFLQATSTPTLGILAASSLELEPGELCTGEGLVGSGPFTVVDYQPDNSVRVEAWEDYDQASALRGHTGRAYLDAIDYSIASESSVRTGLLTSGQSDAVFTVAPQDEQALVDAGFQIISHVNEGFPYHLYANTENPILAETAVRQAIQIGFDRQEITDSVLTPTHGVVSGALSDTNPFYIDQSDALAYDPDRARELLDDAGWVPGDDGIRVKDGTRLSLRVFFYQGHQDVLQLVQARLVEIGIELELREVDSVTGSELQAAGDYDLFQTSGTRADADLLRARFLPSGANYLHLPPDHELEELLTAQAAEGDWDARFELVRQAQEILINDGYEIPLYLYVIVVGAAENVHGLGFDSAPRTPFYDAWVEVA